MTDLVTRKRELRKKMLAKRAAEDPQARTEADRKIMKTLVSLPAYEKANTVFCYVSTEGETDTRALIEDALRKGKRVCVPLCQSMGVMQAHEITGLQDLQSGKYDIPEPKPECPPISPEQIDLNIVPCVCANPDGYRLGYGGGFYDRWLEKSEAPSVLLCRESLITEEVPVEPHDRQTDILITDARARVF
jgi:5-formyltetrahydrofolate cyclo-ligase